MTHCIRRPFMVWVTAVPMLAAGDLALAQVRVANVSDFTGLYDQQGPAVVAISAVQMVRHPAGLELPDNHPFHDFFHHFGQSPDNVPREIEQESEGSGFIISADGYLVTNAHVVEGAKEVNVKLTDLREFKATIVGADKLTDIALLKIGATDLPKVTIGDPGKLRVGEWVVAIGKPFGLENSMTAGIVSAKARDLPDEDLVPFIQTDAAVNPGNSGGPLLNLEGEVVGITSMIYSESGGFMGISFAIPIDIAMATVTQLKDKGRVTRGRIGVDVTEVTGAIAESFGLARPGGALVNAVEKDGPAANGGVEAGDIILAIDGREVQSVTDFPRMVTAIAPGTKIALTVWRQSVQRKLAVTVAELADAESASSQPTGDSARPPKPNRMGLALSNLSGEQKKMLDVADGVLIEGVVNTVHGNVLPGDVIIALVMRGQTTAAKTVEQVNALVSGLVTGTSVTLRLMRGEQEFFASLRVIDNQAR